MKPKLTDDHTETTKIMLHKPGMAVAYLNSVLEDDDDPRLLLLALRNVVDAFGGIGKLALKTKLNRENLYRILSLNGNPEVHSLQLILDALGFKFVVKVKSKEKSSIKSSIQKAS